MTDIDHKEAFIAALDSEIRREWHWEKFNRTLYMGTNLAIWIARLLLLALSVYQINIGKDVQSWNIFSIAALSMLNIALPLLFVTFKFQQRQEVYDRNAREYSVIRVELLAGTISLDEAVVRFKEIHRQPTEVIIRQIP